MPDGLAVRDEDRRRPLRATRPTRRFRRHAVRGGRPARRPFRRRTELLEHPRAQTGVRGQPRGRRMAGRSGPAYRPRRGRGFLQRRRNVSRASRRRRLEQAPDAPGHGGLPRPASLARKPPMPPSPASAAWPVTGTSTRPPPGSRRWLARTRAWLPSWVLRADCAMRPHACVPAAGTRTPVPAPAKPPNAC